MKKFVVIIIMIFLFLLNYRILSLKEIETSPSGTARDYLAFASTEAIRYYSFFGDDYIIIIETTNKLYKFKGTKKDIEIIEYLTGWSSIRVEEIVFVPWWLYVVAVFVVICIPTTKKSFAGQTVAQTVTQTTPTPLPYIKAENSEERSIHKQDTDIPSFCQKCGKPLKLSEDLNFCPYCGLKIK